MIKKVSISPASEALSLRADTSLTDGKALVKLVAPEILIRDREEKAALLLEKASKKAAHKAAEEAKRMERLERGRVPPSEMFFPANCADGYTAFDATGMPTLDAEGVELTKSKSKNLKKSFDQQAKLHKEVSTNCIIYSQTPC